jgi:hypothetical protein
MRCLKPRFALRSLFALVAIVGGVCAYHVEWIRKRHQLLADSIAAGNGDGPITKQDGIDSLMMHQRISPQNRTNLLWLFGEPYHERVTIFRIVKYTPSDPPTVNDYHEVGKLMDKLEKAEAATAEKYFPESEIVLHVRSLPP